MHSVGHHSHCMATTTRTVRYNRLELVRFQISRKDRHNSIGIFLLQSLDVSLALALSSTKGVLYHHQSAFSNKSRPFSSVPPSLYQWLDANKIYFVFRIQTQLNFLLSRLGSCAQYVYTSICQLCSPALYQMPRCYHHGVVTGARAYHQHQYHHRMQMPPKSLQTVQGHQHHLV